MRRPFVFLMVVFFLSCEKETTMFPLVGKWKLDNGMPLGCLCSIPADPMDVDVLELTIAGKYNIQWPVYLSSISSAGRYRLVNDSTIVFTPQSDSSVPMVGIYSRSSKQLTVEYNDSTLGKIKQRFVKRSSND